MAPSHDLNHVNFSLVSAFGIHLSVISVSVLAAIPYYGFENHTFKIADKSPRGQWVKIDSLKWEFLYW